MKRRKRGSSPSSLRLRGTLSSCRELAQLVPQLAPGLDNVLAILDAVDQVDQNKQDLRALTKRLVELSNDFANAMAAQGPILDSVLQDAFAEFLKSIDEVAKFITVLHKRIKIAAFAHRKRDKQTIAQLNSRLDQVVARLTLSNAIYSATTCGKFAQDLQLGLQKRSRDDVLQTFSFLASIGLFAS